MAKNNLVYKAIDGKKYKCRVIATYESNRHVDIQLEAPNEDLIFIYVPLEKPTHSYKKSASLEVM